MPSICVPGFRDLIVYQRAGLLADELRASIALWPSFDRWTLGAQAMRAADSIHANLAEAAGRWDDPDRRRIVRIARGSAFELEAWFERAKARNLELPADANSRAVELSKMLTGLLKKLTD